MLTTQAATIRFNDPGMTAASYLDAPEFEIGHLAEASVDTLVDWFPAMTVVPATEPRELDAVERLVFHVALRSSVRSINRGRLVR